MPSQFRTKDFLSLKKIWYDKLNQSGFKDIESSETDLKLWHSEYFSDPRRYDPKTVEARECYYRIAGQFLNDHKFKNNWEKKVWEMHTNGMSIKEISLTINRPGLKNKIHITLNRLESEMINKAKGNK